MGPAAAPDFETLLYGVELMNSDGEWDPGRDFAFSA